MHLEDDNDISPSANFLRVVDPPKNKIILALDVNNLDDACRLATQLKDHVGLFKIGLEFIYMMLAELITPDESFVAGRKLEQIRELFGQTLYERIFLDGKLDDIPNTIGGAAKQIIRLVVNMFNIHGSAGFKAIVEAAKHKGRSKLLVVSVLTSHHTRDSEIIFGSPSEAKVLQFAREAALAGADGLICSPQELAFLANEPKLERLTKVTPAIRPLWARKNDQERVTTPRAAILAGADYLVIGRPITDPPPEIGSPIEAAKRITEEIEEALNDKAKGATT